MQKVVHGNSNTATSAGKCTGNSATATKLQTARNIKLQGAVSGNANFDGSSNITITTTQANIAILTGTVNGDNLELDYPAGFTKDNCICISAMLQNPNNVSGTWGLCTGGIFNSSSYVTGSMPSKILLSTKINIQLRIVNIIDGEGQTVYANSTTANFNYKIVLMKV